MLVGTASVEKSELLSKKLLRAGIPHEVLNAKNHAREAAIIAQAGRIGAVTVATNMAGRGTDIILGGNVDFAADLELRSKGLSPSDETAEEYEAGWVEAVAEATKKSASEAEKVRKAGGLYVLGTERHESRRIDNQLRGRSGRQGDPGESRFYLSLGDDLMRRVGGQTVEALMTRLRMPEDIPIEHNFVSKAIKNAQTQVEQQNYEIRKNVLKYDEVMNQQRKVIYEERRRVLAGEDLHEQVQHMITDVVNAYVSGATSEGFAEDWDTDTLWAALKTLFPIGVTFADIEEAGAVTVDSVKQAILDNAREVYAKREETLTPPIMRELERRVVLSVLDRKWREHLYEMDYLKEGIGLRAMAQRDPLVEYQREGFDMFQAMLDSLKEESVGFLYNLQVQVTTQDATPVTSDAPAGAVAAAPTAVGNGAAQPAAAGNGATKPPAATAAAPDRTVADPAEGSCRGQRAGDPRERAVRTAGEGTGSAGRQTGRAQVLRARRGRVGAQQRSHRGRVARRDQHRGRHLGGAQRAVPVRIRQEVQAVPRPTWRGRLTAAPIGCAWLTRPTV